MAIACNWNFNLSVSLTSFVIDKTQFLHLFFTVCSGDEDQGQERIKKLAEILREHEVSSSLRAVGVEVISCIIQINEGRTPMRHSFHWSATASPGFQHVLSW